MILEMDRKHVSLLKDSLEAGGAPVMWERVVVDSLPEIRRYTPEGSHLLELGYGNGLLSCYL